MSDEDHRFQCVDGDLASARLTWDGSHLRVEQPGARWGEFVFLGFFLLLLAPVLIGAVAIIVVSLKTAIFSGVKVAYLLAFFFIIALVPGICVCVWLQSMMFSYKLQLHPGSGRYRLHNGILWILMTISADRRKIHVYPTYSRSAWGYGACLFFRLGRLPVRFPLIPKSIFGTKHEAFKEAERLVDWLHRIASMDDVLLNGWGKHDEIVAGVDYIR